MNNETKRLYYEDCKLLYDGDDEKEGGHMKQKNLIMKIVNYAMMIKPNIINITEIENLIILMVSYNMMVNG